MGPKFAPVHLLSSESIICCQTDMQLHSSTNHGNMLDHLYAFHWIFSKQTFQCHCLSQRKFVIHSVSFSSVVSRIEARTLWWKWLFYLPYYSFHSIDTCLLPVIRQKNHVFKHFRFSLSYTAARDYFMNCIA